MTKAALKKCSFCVCFGKDVTAPVIVKQSGDCHIRTQWIRVRLYSQRISFSVALQENITTRRGAPKTKLELLVGGACPALQLIEQDMCEDLVVFDGECHPGPLGVAVPARRESVLARLPISLQ